MAKLSKRGYIFVLAGLLLSIVKPEVDDSETINNPVTEASTEAKSRSKRDPYVGRGSGFGYNNYRGNNYMHGQAHNNHHYQQSGFNTYQQPGFNAYQQGGNYQGGYNPNQFGESHLMQSNNFNHMNPAGNYQYMGQNPYSRFNNFAQKTGTVLQLTDQIGYNPLVQTGMQIAANRAMAGSYNNLNYGAGMGGFGSELGGYSDPSLMGFNPYSQGLVQSQAQGLSSGLGQTSDKVQLIDSNDKNSTSLVDVQQNVTGDLGSEKLAEFDVSGFSKENVDIASKKNDRSNDSDSSIDSKLKSHSLDSDDSNHGELVGDILHDDDFIDGVSTSSGLSGNDSSKNASKINIAVKGGSSSIASVGGLQAQTNPNLASQAGLFPSNSQSSGSQFNQQQFGMQNNPNFFQQVAMQNLPQNNIATVIGQNGVPMQVQVKIMFNSNGEPYRVFIPINPPDSQKHASAYNNPTSSNVQGKLGIVPGNTPHFNLGGDQISTLKDDTNTDDKSISLQQSKLNNAGDDDDFNCRDISKKESDQLFNDAKSIFVKVPEPVLLQRWPFLRFLQKSHSTHPIKWVKTNNDNKPPEFSIVLLKKTNIGESPLPKLAIVEKVHKRKICIGFYSEKKKGILVKKVSVDLVHTYIV